ncbi:hypothetical protein FF36_02620 [Frankia torreyi]|uniref:DUF3052 domain-containing protein n=2 Tax=Frankia TaxID=1854 RepID=A0A0D8BG29_9ACTN|nr:MULTISPECIES: DUF3052 family protein [Frankia]KJE23020.1 hypothetical protein FF36_02620 [Frankia torreyi]KQM05183.1 hypothetical protein FF86_101822 [Frankia sp. CpI1-P]
MGSGSAGRAGYSGTPLARKLGVKAGHRLVILAAPPGWAVPELPEGVEPEHLAGLPADGTDGTDGLAAIDVCVAFCRREVDVHAAVAAFAEAIRPAGALWIAWPRRAAGHRSDVSENLIREVALPRGLVDTKVAALDENWSGLKVVWRRERR